MFDNATNDNDTFDISKAVCSLGQYLQVEILFLWKETFHQYNNLRIFFLDVIHKNFNKLSFTAYFCFQSIWLQCFKSAAGSGTDQKKRSALSSVLSLQRKSEKREEEKKKKRLECITTP